MSALDAIDQRILQTLQEDSRISNADLAEKAGLSASSCWRRVKALEESGVVRHYTVALDDEKQGLGFGAIVHVHLTRHDPEQLDAFIRAVQNRPEIRACYATTGQADYHLHVVCADIEAYNLFLERVLFRIPAVASAQTNVILRTIKR
ncbi:Lrp/AsnC family transcriptional regulator [Seohaeicola sp. SP36]|uniref:Lrp/AsnC family transcriptional regulator n=1 Tax=unclassified Seohaeicola TaxID=2641111 RepID=UPI00237BC7C3|nr:MULTISPECIES: Lrp/AsnC family transcriptional regulator [unclassified Seohaeicola]MDD9709035.1 Lrp/AsnC family transcriptional regulator [Seohaeicola sp. 4SK31]MDD9737121.1 Lrp/AsnC family transcriptional regulator [Seohaeicola sp. SP36]